MKILALDLGTKTGWACSFDGGSGIWDLTPRRHESTGMRWLKFKQSLFFVSNFIELVVYEEIAKHKGTHAAHIYGGLLAILQEWCSENKIEYQGVPVGTIKKFATGKGNANKEQMILAANAITGRGLVGNQDVVTDNNEADAICLLAYAEEQFKTATEAEKEER